MSRIPAAPPPPQFLPAPHPHQQQQQAMYYQHPHPHAPPPAHAPPAHAPHASYHDPGMYQQYPRPSSNGMPYTSQGNDYQMAGPSRVAAQDPYSSQYGQQPPAPPGAPYGATNARNGPAAAQGALPPAGPGPAGPPGVGWSSVHPAASKGMARQLTNGSASGAPGRSQGVKLEDLVSSDRNRPPTSKGAVPAGGLTSMPLGTASDMKPGIPGGAGAAALGPGAGGEGTGGGQPGPSEFIKKLYKMLEEESAMYGKGRAPGQPRGEGAKRGSVGWGRGGSSFVVWDMNDFTTKILPQTFRHSNFSSFVRQLNKYGFSKIKHVDEDTGQIKENVWEFQHPNFQAGGKADLDSIKRKAVVPKKGGDADTDGFSGKVDGALIAEMENRITNLEEGLAKTMDALDSATVREATMMSLMREMISHMATVERDSVGSPSSQASPSPRIANMYHLFDQLATNSLSPRPMPFGTMGTVTPTQSQASAMPYTYNPPGSAFRGMSNVPSGAVSAIAHASPATDGTGSVRGDGNSPAGSRGSQRPTTNQGASGLNGMTAAAPQAQEDLIEIPQQQPPPDPNQTLYNGEPLSMTPVFAETPPWLVEGTQQPLPIYHRKSSDEATLRLMVEALTSHGAPVRIDDGLPDPLDVTSAAATGAAGGSVQQQSTAPQAVVQQSPFGTLLIPTQGAAEVSEPPQAQVAGPSASTGQNGNRLRRSTTIKPHWTHSPKILVVEDDVVYRQLSSKFLEKFGCVTETVEDAQGAIEKMNKTKYDLVLMDIFFGPNMDGRKATSLIRQFDIYTPIISMTSNVQTQDVDSYLQSGMNDVLAKPFTKHGLFGILDKHLMHLKAIQLSAEIPRSLGVPPLSDQGVVDALATAAQWGENAAQRNPLAGMGWSDDTYQLVLSQFMSTGSMPEVANISNGTIGTTMIFPESSAFTRKRSLETVDDGWSPATSINVNGAGPSASAAGAGMGGMNGEGSREAKKMKP